MISHAPAFAGTGQKVNVSISRLTPCPHLRYLSFMNTRRTSIEASSRALGALLLLIGGRRAR
jgi:hypothetical protein